MEQTSPQSFEQALARLEEIAGLLDRSDVPLTDALALSEEATALRRYCLARLQEAEGKLHQLEELANGDMRLTPISEE